MRTCIWRLMVALTASYGLFTDGASFTPFSTLTTFCLTYSYGCSGSAMSAVVGGVTAVAFAFDANGSH